MAYGTIAALLAAPAAHAQTDPEKLPSTQQPVLLQADQIDYDQPNDVVFATGHVEIVQGESVVIADSLIYDRKRNQVQAMGNVSVLEPSGHVMFAQAVSLQDDLKRGVITEFRSRLNDGSVIAANGARKFDESRTELYKAAFSPCRCEEDGKPIPPTWALHAATATIDQQEKKIAYEDAYVSLFGVPVIYTPYFSHPTPDAQNQSGVLMPEFLQSRNLGGVFKLPLYYAIAPDRDITVTPIVTTQEGVVLAANYRQRFDGGQLRFNASGTNVERRDDLGNRTTGREFRGHIDTSGAFQIDENYDWGFNIRRASDETYLRLYNFGNDPFLNSRIYAQGFNFIGDATQRSYGSIEALSFQGLTDRDASAVIPIVAPLMFASWQSDPLDYNSRFTVEGGTMALFRDRGAQSRRFTGTMRWNMPYVTSGGQVLEFETQLRTDVYNVDSVQLTDGRNFDGTTARLLPQASVLWHYPFVNRFEGGSLMVEPVVNAVVSPSGGNPEEIPNEDSLLPDFSDVNLFSSNRYAGYDRVETGPRVSYGLRGEAQSDSGYVLDAVFGQQYRVTSDVNFPIASGDPGSDLSDYVGRVGLSKGTLSGSYRFRLDEKKLFTRRNEIEASYNEKPFAFATSYLQLRNDPVLGDREIANMFATYDLTENWSVIGNGSRDLDQKETIRVNGGVVYKNECVNVTTMVGKDYTNLLDVKPSLSFWVRVSLKNLD